MSKLTSFMETFKSTGGTSPVDAKVTVVRGSTPATEVIAQGSEKKPFRAIVIGSDDWVDNNTGTYVKNAEPAAMLTALFDSFDPGVFLANLNKNTNFQRVPPAGIETKNGVQAIHYHADQSTTLNPPNPTVPPGSVFDIWISTDNDYLVALEASGLKDKDGSTGTLQIELTNVNDPSLSVKAPS
jgi:hypothetical protein